jgi:hypothetical protein
MAKHGEKVFIACPTCTNSIRVFYTVQIIVDAVGKLQATFVLDDKIWKEHRARCTSASVPR